MGNESEVKHLEAGSAGATQMMAERVLLLSCPDEPGIAHQLSCFLAGQGCNTIDVAQHRERHAGRFFMRVRFASAQPGSFAARFSAFAARRAMRWQLHDADKKMRVVLMVSRFGHCLNDLLFRCKSGLLPIEIAAVVSNHTDFADLAASYRVPFLHFPVRPGGVAESEERLLKLVHQGEIELVVLARYMQILSPELCTRLSGRLVNIHHSFLPSFKGAKPYGQAHERGVKLIGATAHFVTPDLDEGPIIEQDVTRVDHTHAPEQLSAIGRDAECVVLARAVQWIAEHRVILNGRKTVVFN